ncbi:superoxide dismutase, partial [Vibrio cholerae]
MRCQPLRRALCLISITDCHCFYIQSDVFGYHLEL